MSEIAREVRITGRVQGVGFRAWVQARAERLGLRGWVRNEADGSVAALISGEREQVSQMLRDLREGPIGSSVSEVTADEAETPPGRGFEVRR